MLVSGTKRALPKRRKLSLAISSSMSQRCSRRKRGCLALRSMRQPWPDGRRDHDLLQGHAFISGGQVVAHAIWPYAAAQEALLVDMALKYTVDGRHQLPCVHAKRVMES